MSLLSRIEAKNRSYAVSRPLDHPYRPAHWTVPACAECGKDRVWHGRTFVAKDLTR